jgi:hypothetical protein
VWVGVAVLAAGALVALALPFHTRRAAETVETTEPAGAVPPLAELELA